MRADSFTIIAGHSRSPTKAQNSFVTFHDILPAHAITTSPTKRSPPSNSGSRFLTSATTRRSQSTRIPSSSSNEKNTLHSRSKSVSNETARNRNQRIGSPRHQSHQYVNSSHSRHAPSPSSTKDVGKAGFSFSSALQSLSRTLTTVCVRDRTRQPTPAQHRSGNDTAGSYRRL